MKKKRFVFYSAVLLVTMVLTSCGSNSTTDNEEISTEETEESAFESENESYSESLPVTVFDTAEYSVVITDVSGEGMDTVITLEYTCKTDSSYDFYIEGGSINGLSCNFIFSDTVEENDSAVREIKIADINLGVEIDECTDIALNVSVYDEDFLLVDSLTQHFYPNGASAATTYDETENIEGTVLVNNEYVTLTLVETQEDTENDVLEVLVYIENKADFDIMCFNGECTVNGEAFDPSWTTTVFAEETMYSTIYFSESLLDSAIEDVVFSFIGKEHDSGEELFTESDVEFSV